MQFALRELQAIFTSNIRLLSMALAVALLAISGPFGTLDYDGPVRLLYWAVVVVGAYALGQVTGSIAVNLWFANLSPAPLRMLLTALLASLPTFALVYIATWLAEPDPAPSALLIWFYVFAVCLALVVLLLTLKKPTLATPQAPPALLERLPKELRGPLLALSVSDHYVDVFTEKGKALVLMRLSDAIKETAPIDGLQIHRSHWVAKSAVKTAVRDGGKLFLVLHTGLRLPVSRSFMDAVKQAGLM